MGLDITVYWGLKRSESQEFDHEDGRVKFCQIDEFKGREEGVEVGVVYDYEGSDKFRAGSYGGYNSWREQLAQLAAYPPTPHLSYGDKAPRMLCAAACWNGATGPFAELINFADNEGVIGPVVARKLAQDFVDFEAAARLTGDQFFVAHYELWKNAFERASNNGAVAFH